MSDNSSFSDLREALSRADSAGDAIPELPKKSEFSRQEDVLTQLDKIMAGGDMPSPIYLKTLLQAAKALILQQNEKLKSERELSDKLCAAAMIGQRISYNTVVRGAQERGLHFDPNLVSDNNSIATALRAYDEVRGGNGSTRRAHLDKKA